jgi:soluble lytic murein transglycosylase-like protein
MQRTRKFAHVAPEAKRLAALGLSPTAIAAQLGVNRSTVQRWMAAGQIEDTRVSRAGPAGPLVADLPAVQWAAAIRAAYALDATDAELVGLADFALSVTQNASELPSIRLAAAGRFQSLVKHLATRIRPTADEQPAAPDQNRAASTARADPRALLNPTIQ